MLTKTHQFDRFKVLREILDTLIIFHRKGNKMRFNYEAYEKVFPKEEPKPVIESAVETFKPTENEKPTEQAGDDMASVEIPEEPTDSAEEQPEGENNE